MSVNNFKTVLTHNTIEIEHAQYELWLMKIVFKECSTRGQYKALESKEKTVFTVSDHSMAFADHCTCDA